MPLLLVQHLRPLRLEISHRLELGRLLHLEVCNVLHVLQRQLPEAPGEGVVVTSPVTTSGLAEGVRATELVSCL